MNSKKSLVFAGTNENGFQIINVNKEEIEINHKLSIKLFSF
jgi:hypothetical protein